MRSGCRWNVARASDGGTVKPMSKRLQHSFPLFDRAGDAFKSAADPHRDPQGWWGDVGTGAYYGATGALEYIASPIRGAMTTVVGRPVEILTANGPHGTVFGMPYDTRLDRQAAGGVAFDTAAIALVGPRGAGDSIDLDRCRRECSCFPVGSGP